jgi:hypothetical protein
MLEYKTQIIKLQNGTDLIANVALNNMGSYILEEPMEFGLDYRARDAGLVMKHWLPVQLIKKNSIELLPKDVLSMLEPENEFCEYYINTVSKIKELMKAKELLSDMDDNDIGNMITEFEELENYGNTLH